MTAKDHVEIVPLGGVGEFGMNMMAYRHNGTIIVVDAGLMFPRDDLLGVDLVVPELTYLLEHRDEVKAVILTHGHEDHIGSLPFLIDELPVPVYGTPLTLGLARGRLQERRLLDRVSLNNIQPRDRLEFGDVGLEFLSVTHSIADAVSVALTTPVGRIVHTSDFKFDQSPPDHRLSDYAGLSAFGETGVLALFSDSTNSERPGYTPSEDRVRRNIEQVFHSSRKKIFVACFASSIHRIQIIMDLAKEFGRRVVPVGRSMKQNTAIAQQLGYLKIAAGVIAEPSEAAKLPAEKLVLLSTGSQGEPMAALARFALGKNKDFSIEPGDCVVISARVIPGNESRLSHIVNHLCRRGARVFDEGHSMLHVSGHASQEELKLMLNLTRPRFFIPIHGEYRQLFNHALLAQGVGIPEENILLVETGDIIRIKAESAEVVGKAPVGRRLIDEGGIADLDEVMVRDRQHLSEEGVVLAVVAINQSTARMEGAPELLSRGHILEAAGAALLSDARSLIAKTVEEATEEERRDSVVLTELLRADLKRFFRKRTSTRPMIVPVVLEI